MSTYYELLGVPIDAAPEELRRAYLAMARELHPDRTHAMPKARAEQTSRRMQQVNEAWRVLRDPRSRAAYDRAMANAGFRMPRSSQRPQAESGGDDDDDLDTPFAHTPAHPGDIGVSIARVVPWLAIAVVLIGIFVFTAFAGDERDSPRPTAYVGKCLSSSSGSAAVAVPCEGPNDGRVVRVVSASSDCPSGSTGREVGASWLCMEPVHPAPTLLAPTTTTTTTRPT